MSKNKIWICLAVFLVLTAAAALKYSTESVGQMHIQTAGELSDEEHPKIALTFDDGLMRSIPLNFWMVLKSAASMPPFF